MNHRTPCHLLAAALTLAIAAPAIAQTSTAADGYTIHHNAITTDTLDPKIALTYGLQRSKNRALLNVSVVKEAPGTTGKSTPAQVATKAKNLLGQSWEIPMREIKDGDSYYYIADFLVKNQDTLEFDISVTPAGQSKSYKAKMSQQFFTE